MVIRFLHRLLVGRSLMRPLPRPFAHDAGAGWLACLPGLEHLSDGPTDPRRSPLGLYEDGNALRPAHSLHSDIRSGGRGAFSHWGPALFFSTSDGTDPNTNGRRYCYSLSPGLYRRRTHVPPPSPPPVNHRPRSSSPEAIRADVAYVLDTPFACLHRMLELGASLAGKTVLEIGPGPNFAAVMALAAHGARPAVADRFLAPWWEDYHPKFYAAFADELARRCPAADVRGLRALVEANGYPPEVITRYECPVEDLTVVPPDSVDFVFSNAVAEHLFDVPRAFRQMYRVTRPGGYGLHQIDFRDHQDFSRPLEFLTLDEDEFGQEFRERHGERGNRLRPDEVARCLRRAGFDLLAIEGTHFCTPEYLADFMPRLRGARSRYRRWTADSLRIVSGFFRLRKPAR